MIANETTIQQSPYEVVWSQYGLQQAMHSFSIVSYKRQTRNNADRKSKARLMTKQLMRSIT